MRLLIAFLCLANPACAWEFSPSPVCTLSHSTDELDIAVSYDPAQDQPYAISLTSRERWPNSPVFGLRFSGERDQTITTGNHVLSNDGLSLTVRDYGFGNVLDGLQFNATASAFAGSKTQTVSLEGAAEPVDAFRSCLSQPVA